MATKIYLKLGNIPGDCTDKGHERQIEVMTWTWGLSRPSAFEAGGQGLENQPIANDLTLTKWIDVASPRILLACCKGQQIDRAVLEVWDDGKTVGRKKAQPYDRAKRKEGFRLTMENVVLVNISLSGNFGIYDQTESLYIKFARFAYEVLGKDAGGDPVRWDILKNSTF